MIKKYNDELTSKIKNVDFNTKLANLHNINRRDINSMYKNFYETNNCISLSKEEIELDNLSFSCYENWLVRSDDN